MTIRILCISTLLALSGAGWAADEVPPAVNEGLQKLEKLSPGLQTEKITTAPVDGLYEFVADGRVMYVTGDGRYLISGQIIDLETRTTPTRGRELTILQQVLGNIGNISAEQVLGDN